MLLALDPDADSLDEPFAGSPPTAAAAVCPGWALLLAWGPDVDAPAAPPDAVAVCPGLALLLAQAAANA